MSDGFNIFKTPLPDLPRPGDQVGHYQVEAELAEGGMARVYRARDLHLGRQVALKFPVFQDELAFADEVEALRQRFLREAQVMARLNHPGIVQIYDVRLHEPWPFFVMEFVPGQTLHDRKSAEPALTFLEVTEIALPVVRALRFAWEQCQVVHRDLKPANVMLGAQGTIKILDMGLAKIMGVDPNSPFQTRTGLTAGTPEYMAPEQHTGDKDLDHRVDIFSLGVMLCELYTGRNPFPGDNFLLAFQAKAKGVPFPIAAAAPGLPPAAAQLVDQMLKFERHQRIASYAEIEAAMTAVAEGLRIGKPGAARTVTLSRKKPTVRMPKEARFEMGTGYGSGPSVYTTPTAFTGSRRSSPLAGPCWTFAPGTEFSHYRLDELLGRGSFGAVYRAQDLDRQEPVCLKFLDLPKDGGAGARLADIGNRLSQLQHEAICQTRESGTSGAYAFITTDLIRPPANTPCNLHYYRSHYGTEDGHVSEGQVCKVGLFLLQALEAAHAQDLLHGNLKPANVLFDCVGVRDGGYLRLHTKVTDFGLTMIIGAEHIRRKLTSLDPNSTEATATLGETLLYLSPEQWQGTEPSIAGDVYSAGMLIHYFLTGHAGLESGQSPSVFRPGIHPGWDPILRKARRPEPERRFGSAAEFAECLSALG